MSGKVIGSAVRCGLKVSAEITRRNSYEYPGRPEIHLGWVPAHKGIPGNEDADKEAKIHTRRPGRIATGEGIRMIGKQARKESRGQESIVGLDTLEAQVYTWLDTNRGPFKAWLHKIGKANEDRCRVCGQEAETAEHVVQCWHNRRWSDLRVEDMRYLSPVLQDIRKRLLHPTGVDD